MYIETHIHIARSCSHDGSCELIENVFGTKTSPTARTPASSTKPVLTFDVESASLTNLLPSALLGTP